jgi:hypothetical protein
VTRLDDRDSVPVGAGLLSLPQYPDRMWGQHNLVSDWYSSSLSKAVSLHRAGVKGERKYSSYSFLTPALDGGEWSASHPGRSSPPIKGSPVPIYRRLVGPQSRSGHRGYRTSPLLEWPETGADHSPPYSAEVNTHGAIPPLHHPSTWLGA